MFPVVLLLIFATVFGGQTVNVRGGIKTTTYYVPAIITLSVISATMQSLAMSLTIAREDGRLKRGRGTPMPAWVFVAGRVGNAIVVSLLMLALLAAIGAVLYGVDVPWDRLPAILLTLDGGGRLLLLPRSRPDRSDPLPGRRRADRQRNPPSPLLPIRGLHPRRPACRTGSSTSPTPSRSGTSSRPSSAPTCPPEPEALGIEWDNLAIVAIWGIAGLLFAVRYFRWTPEIRLSRPGAAAATRIGPPL